MSNVRNISARPLSVPLPHGKVLFLGPGKTGDISTQAEKHPALLKLIDSGELEFVGQEHGAATAQSSDGSKHVQTHGQPPNKAGQSRGDR
jgi:hypothetical protein